MYRQLKDSIFGPSDTIQRIEDNAYIPFNLSNRDYVQFKNDILEGKELQDADGNTMTASEAKAFVTTLP